MSTPTMTRLTRLLLAGTLVPALVLVPFAGASAQTPEKEKEKHGGEAPAPKGPPPGAPHVGVPRPPAPALKEVPRAAAPAPQRAEPAAIPKAAEPERKREAMPGVPHGPEHNGPEHNRAGAPPQAPATAQKAAEPAAPPKAVEPAKKVAEPERKATPASPQGPAHNGPEHNRAGVPPHAPGTAPAATATPAAPTPAAPTPPHNAVREPGAPGQRATAPAATPNAAPPAAQNGPRPGGPGAPPPGAPAGAPPAAYGNRQGGGGISPGGAAAIGAAAGFAGGFLAATGAQRLDEIRRDRRESVEDGRTYIREPGRTIIQDGDRSFIVHDENDRFRELGYNVQRERRGDDFVDIIDRPGGIQILTFTTPDGRMLRRVRRFPDGREVVLIDNGYGGRVRPVEQDIVVLPPPPIDIPRNRYVVDYADADEGLIYDTFEAPPLRALPRRYTLDQIRYSPDIRGYVRSVDINTINFDTGSWIVQASSTGKLLALGTAIKRAVEHNPSSVFLVEGFTDATGNPTDNLSLSDRRAQSVAAILSKDFGVPPENLTTQGYGQQYLKENTQGPSVANRRVVVQNITPLLAAGGPPSR